MQTLTGELGSVKWLTTLADSAGGQQVQGTAVAEVRSWTVDYTKDAIEDTAMGDGARTYISGLTSWSGTMECLFNTSQAGLAIFDPSIDSTLLVQFITDTTTAGTSYQGSVVVTSVSRTASFDDMITATVSFQGTGTLGEIIHT